MQCGSTQNKGCMGAQMVEAENQQRSHTLQANHKRQANSSIGSPAYNRHLFLDDRQECHDS